MSCLRLAPILILLGVCAAAPAAAQIDRAPKVQVRLIAENSEIHPGSTVTVALEEVIRPGWHTYWRNPGDAGAPTQIHWTLPEGWIAGAIAWPYPKELPVGPLMDYGYDNTVWLLIDVTAPQNAVAGSTVSLRAAVNWLVCKEVCIPEDGMLTLSFMISKAPQPPYAWVAAQFAAARAKLPVRSPWPARFRLGTALDLFLAAPPLASAHPAAAHFFPFEQGTVKGIAPQLLATVAGGLTLRLVPGRRARGAHALGGVLVLTSADGSVQAISINAVPGAVPAVRFHAQPRAGLGLPFALLFAFLGGLILNLMPCVLPILAVKALALASQAGRAAGTAASEALAYGGGAVVSFAALGAAVIALRAGGEAIGWGFQLQQPEAVAGFALLMFAVGLNLSGVFEIPVVGTGDVLARRGGIAGAFFTGVLAVLVAAPCTAPFMAAALGFALTQSAFVALLVFVGLGIGFAAPFVAAGLSPAVLRLLPKPGPWMATFRQFLAFPMYATALWLAWVMSVETAPTRLVVLLAAALATAFSLWAAGAAQRSNLRALVWIAIFLGVFALTQLVPLVGAGASQGMVPAGAIPSQAYSEARLASLRAQRRGVFVDVTAAWCVTCLVNEKVSIDNARVRRAFAADHIALLVADWTRRDPAVTRLLEAHGRLGVPLYLYFAPGSTEATILPQVLTPEEILDAIGAR